MRVSFSEGKFAQFGTSNEAVDYLQSFITETRTVEPEKIFIRNDNKSLYLVIFDGTASEYKIRKSFLEKLLKWYSFPIRQLEYFDIDTITAMCNDYIINIKAKLVNIKIEEGEALTITSENFTDVSDVTLISKLKDHGIERIFIDDYGTSIRTVERHKLMPFKGDEFGMGMMITNSETGFSALRIQDFLLRYICSNGAYVRENNNVMKFYHYNLFVQDVFDTIKEMTMDIETRGARIEERIKKMEEPISAENISLVNKNIIRATAIKLLNDVMNTDRQLTRYELFNLITERAKAYSFNYRMRLEAIAGELINS